MLSMMLVGALNGGEGDSSMMAPMMTMLLENMLSQQVREENQAEESQGQETAQAGGGIAAVAANAYRGMGDGVAPAGLPVQGAHLTQSYHAGHNGLDFGVAVGTPVISTMSGQIVYSGWNNEGYGNLVIVESGQYRTYYAHLSELPLPVGTQVRAGQVIAKTGNTGNSTGPHLHYEIRVNRQAIDPTTATL